jgi:uncharacterized protein (DUF885 family)
MFAAASARPPYRVPAGRGGAALPRHPTALLYSPVMTPTFRRMVVLLAPVLALALLARAAAQESNSASRSLHALFEAEWEWQLEQDPVLASYLGDRRYNDRWADHSVAAIDGRHEHRVGVMAQLRAIDRTALSPADQLNYDLFEKELRNEIEAHAFRTYLLPVNHRNGIHTADELAELLRFETTKDYEDWIARLRAYPRAVDQDMALMRDGVRARILWPKVTIQRIPGQIAKQIVSRPEDSTFYQPFTKFASGISSADQSRLANAARQAISESVIPALKRLDDYIKTEYLPASLDHVGIWQWPRGAEAYAFLARQYTTTNLTPEQIHEKGLGEVARIRGEMQKVAQLAGFTGALKDFFTRLRTSPEFYYKTPEELLQAYRAVAKRIDPQIVKVVKTPPRMPYGVVPIPANTAPDTTTAYYNQPAADGSRAGLFYVNLYKPETRPKYEMMALALHESVPGHHLQIARAMELGDIPKFRRYGGYTAFIEGWGLYAESLGDEMGLYDDPYSKFGQLTYEMWRAVRLVVDTGMHHYRWDRQKAIDYFLDNAAKTELDVVNEIDRYITTPGQALAYKIGELKLKELRAKATRELGERFDPREFHDAVLGSGALPLDVLERTVDRWIEDSRVQEKSKGRVAAATR